MALFSSTQPSLRARILPRFPAQVLAGNGITITKGNGIYTFEVTNQIGGSDTEVQFNDAGVGGGDPTFTFNQSTDVLTVAAITIAGNLTVGGLIESATTTRTGTTTVALLPTVGTKGRRYFVTDATATTFASIVAGGGANNVPVYDDGTNWRIG
jgi:hypothetical protein